jgi:hypothetical protein
MSSEPALEMNLDLDLKLPEHVLSYSVEIQQSVSQYLKQLSNKERIAYTIAKEHLGTSFNIVKSIGYTTWKKPC